MNSNSKNNTEVIFQIFTSFISSITNEEFDMLLNKKAVLSLKPITDKQVNDFDKILEKIKTMKAEEAYNWILEEFDNKEDLIKILKILDISASKNCKKETLIKKIISGVFKENNLTSDLEKVKESLLELNNRQQAVEVLEKLKIAELKQLAEVLKISLPYKTKSQIINCLVQRTVGNRINSEIILSTELK